CQGVSGAAQRATADDARVGGALMRQTQHRVDRSRSADEPVKKSSVASAFRRISRNPAEAGPHVRAFLTGSEGLHYADLFMHRSLHGIATMLAVIALTAAGCARAPEPDAYGSVEATEVVVGAQASGQLV